MQALRNLVYHILYLFDEILHRRSPVVVLSYHSIATNGWRFSVSEQEFSKQLSYLLERYQPITPDDLALHIAGKKIISTPSFLLTFDDAYLDILSIASLIAEHNIRPLVFALAGEEDLNRKEMDNTLPLLTKLQLKSLHDSGWFVGSHGVSHSDFYALTPEQITREVEDSKKIIEYTVDDEVHCFAYPCGRFTDQIIDKLRVAGYSVAFSMEDGMISTNTNPYIIPRVGIDKTHTFNIFKATISPSVIEFRKFVKWLGDVVPALRFLSR